MNRKDVVKLVNDWLNDGSQVLEYKRFGVWNKSNYKDPLDIVIKDSYDYRIVEKPNPIEIEEGTTVRSTHSGIIVKTASKGECMKGFEIAYDQPQNIKMMPWSGGDMPDGVRDREIFVIRNHNNLDYYEYGRNAPWGCANSIGIKWYGIIPKFMVEDKA